MILILGLLGILTGCMFEKEVGGEAQSPSSENIKKEVPIQVTKMQQDIIERTYIAVGEVIPKNQVDIYVTGNGFIETVNVETGQDVQKDQLVLALDKADLDYANYNATESQLRTLRDNLEAQLDRLKETYVKQFELYIEGVVAKVEIDQLADQITSLEREVANAEVSYSNQLSILRNNLDDTSESRRTYSPITGKVAAVYVNEGQAAVNQIGLTIIDDSGLYIRAHVSGDLKKQLHTGDPVRINVNDQQERVHESVIAKIEDIPDIASKLFDVLIEVPNDQAYIIGDYTEIEFIVESYEAVLVPMESIMRRGSDKFIYIHSDNTLIEVQIETGKSKDEWIEVKNIETLSEVVVRGQNQITSLKDFVVIE